MSEITTEDATSTESESQNDEAVTPDETGADESIAGEEALGDPGKKALDVMKQKLRAAEKSAREAAAEVARIRAEAALKDKPAEEQAIAAAVAEATSTATKAADTRIIKTELRLAAKGVLADPADALAFINLDDFTVSDDGEVDSDALNDAIAELLERKPHLAAGKPNRFDGTADQGGKGKPAELGQVTDAQLESMSPAEINQARREGRLNKVLGKTT